MWTFAGCCVIAAVLYSGFRRANHYLYVISLVVERTVNRGMMRTGQPPITTVEDEERARSH